MEEVFSNMPTQGPLWAAVSQRPGKSASCSSPDLAPVQRRLRTFSAQFHDFRPIRAQIATARTDVSHHGADRVTVHRMEGTMKLSTIFLAPSLRASRPGS